MHNISREYNVITTTCRVYRMLPCHLSMKRVAKHSLPRLRHTNLMLSLWDSSQGHCLWPPALWRSHSKQSHSGTIVASHRTIHWLCSMAWCCMVDKHSHRNTSSSFKQIDTSWTSLTSLQSVVALMDLQNDPIVSGFLCQSSSWTSCWEMTTYLCYFILNLVFFLPHFSCHT